MNLRPATYNDLAKNILLKLGGGVVRIELTKEQFEFCVNNAFRWFSVKKGFKTKGELHTQVDISEYNVAGDVYEVLEVIPESGRWTYPVNSDDIFNYNPVLSDQRPLYRDMDLLYMNLANVESMERMVSADFSWEWLKSERKLRILPRPNKIYKIFYYYSCFVNTEQLSLLPLDDVGYIERYATAECKMLLGTMRRKYGGYVGGTGDVSIDSQTLVDEAKEEFEKLNMEIYDSQEPSGGIFFG